MQINVNRNVSNGTSTMGEMHIDGAFFAYTLEDPNRNLNGDASRKIAGDTCIDPGNYKVIITHSARFGKDLPELLDVPCFAGIRIHGGNSAADTEGCILVGANTNNTDRIWGCAEKLAELIARISAATAAGEETRILVSNNFPV